VGLAETKRADRFTWYHAQWSAGLRHVLEVAQQVDALRVAVPRRAGAPEPAGGRAGVVLALREAVTVPPQARASRVGDDREAGDSEGIQLHVRPHDELGEVQQALRVPGVVQERRQGAPPKRKLQEPARLRARRHVMVPAQLQLADGRVCMERSREHRLQHGAQAGDDLARQVVSKHGEAIGFELGEARSQLGEGLGTPRLFEFWQCRSHVPAWHAAYEHGRGAATDRPTHAIDATAVNLRTREEHIEVLFVKHMF
jgi:hypothetical protein